MTNQSSLHLTKTIAPAVLPRGLTQDEAHARARQGQTNRLSNTTTRSYWRIAFDNVFTFYNNVLFGLGIALIVMGQPTDTLVVVGVVLVNVVVSIVQELRAKRMLDSIALLTRPHATVVRDGEEVGLLPGAVVLGDTVLAHAGDQFLVDGAVLYGQGEVDEALLTGESDLITKQVPDRVYSGTFCVSGTLYYQAELVGEQSTANQLAKRARVFRPQLTPLQRDVNLVIQILLLVVAFFEILVIGNALIDQISPLQTVQRSVVVMGIIPVGLFLAITVAYALGAVRLAGHGALIQQANAIESLSHVDMLCLDKTGTLTTNTLTVTATVPIAGTAEALHAALARFTASTTSPNATSTAIAHAYPGKPGTVLAEVAFASVRKWSALTLTEATSSRTFVLGAPELLFAVIGTDLQIAISAQMAPLIARGLRVLLFASSADALVNAEHHEPTLPASLIPLGLIALTDTLRPEAQHTLAAFAKVGIQIKIISGDHPTTVAAVAQQAGITDVPMISGPELAALDDAQFSEAAEHRTIFGRITPQQKERLVQALRARGHYVAMIGDGINDVLSLKEAQIGIAMQSGSQATRSVADIILLRDTFASLPVAFREGQRIRSGLHHIIMLFFARILFVALMILAVVAMTDSFAFTPKQNSILAFITVGVPALALAVWAKPRRMDQRNLFQDVLHFSLPAALSMTVVGIGVFLGFTTYLGSAVQRSAQTALTDFGVLSGLALMLYVVPLRSFWAVREPVEGDWRPVWLSLGLGGCFLLILALPWLRQFFELAALTPIQSATLIGVVLLWMAITHLSWRFHWLERFLRLHSDPDQSA